MIISNVRILTPDREVVGSLGIDHGKITEINPLPKEGEQVIDGKNNYLSPGFIDVHIHGAGGSDTMDGTVEAIEIIAKTIMSSGTTSFLPTTMTMPLADINRSLGCTKHLRDNGSPGAQVLGVNLEGPFVSGEAIGAQNPNYLQMPSIETYQEMVKGYEDVPKSITIAPELEGAGELINYLARQGILVSAGHSQATYDDMVAAMNCGLSHTTHLYNGMSGLKHRAPGIVGATFDLAGLTTEIITDGIHILWPALRIAFKIKGTDKVCLITDAMRAAGMPDGMYTLGGQDVKVKDGAAHLLTGSLAGSVLTLRRAVKNVWAHTEYPLYEVVKMATKNPAEYAGVADHKGIIAPGYDADLILFDENIDIQKVFIGGEERSIS